MLGQKQVAKMENYALTNKGYMVAQSTNGVKDTNHADFAKWQILYKLKFLHYATKDKLVQSCGITPASFSLAVADLKRHGYVVSSGQVEV
jgi:hypothetical protein